MGGRREGGGWGGGVVGVFFFQAEDGIRDSPVTGVQTCALPISGDWSSDVCSSDLAFYKGQSYLPSLLQMAGTKVVYLFQLSKCGLTDSITNLLSNDNIIKSGVAIDQDLTGLQQILHFDPAGFIDLGDIARLKGLPHHGLRGLGACLLNFRISKSGRTSNWSANQLTKKQIKYAATDAWLGRELYLKYKRINVI